jgi:hypothetical protein
MHVQFGANMCLFSERNGKFEIFSHGQMLSLLGLTEAKVSCLICAVQMSLNNCLTSDVMFEAEGIFAAAYMRRRATEPSNNIVAHLLRSTWKTSIRC